MFSFFESTQSFFFFAMAVLLREAKEWLLYLTGKLDSNHAVFHLCSFQFIHACTMMPNLLTNNWWHFTLASNELMYTQRIVWKPGRMRVSSINFSIRVNQVNSHSIYWLSCFKYFSLFTYYCWPVSISDIYWVLKLFEFMPSISG
jgi:hypothetical protein